MGILFGIMILCLIVAVVGYWLDSNCILIGEIIMNIGIASLVISVVLFVVFYIICYGK